MLDQFKQAIEQFGSNPEAVMQSVLTVVTLEYSITPGSRTGRVLLHAANNAADTRLKDLTWIFNRVYDEVKDSGLSLQDYVAKTTKDSLLWVSTQSESYKAQAKARLNELEKASELLMAA